MMGEIWWDGRCWSRIIEGGGECVGDSAWGGNRRGHDCRGALREFLSVEPFLKEKHMD